MGRQFSATAIGFIASVIFIQLAAIAGAQTLSSWKGGQGNWSDGTHWTPTGVPNSSFADVSIGPGLSPPFVSLDGAFTVGRLTIEAVGSGSSQPLVINAGATLTIAAGSFAGSGQLNLSGYLDCNAPAGMPPVAIQISGNVTVSNPPGRSGIISLVNRTISGLTSGSSLTLGAGPFDGNSQEIQGAGNIGTGSLQITNNGFITANIGNVPLIIQPATGTTMINNRWLTAQGATLQLAGGGGTFTNNDDFQVNGMDSSPATLTVAPGALTNFSGTTLTGGSYDLFSPTAVGKATLSFGGGSIVTNAGFIWMRGPGCVFNELNALADNRGGLFLSEVGDANYLPPQSPGRDFTTLGPLTNSGALSVFRSTMTITGAFTQTATGELLGDGTYVGNSFALAGRIFPGNTGSTPLYINGSYTNFNTTGTLILQGNVAVDSAAQFYFDLGTDRDHIKVVGDLVLGGTLNVNASNFQPDGFGAGTYDLIEYSGKLTYQGLDIGQVPAGFTYKIDTTSQPGHILQIVTPAPARAQLLNIATRLRVQGGDKVLIGGFIITGTAPKKVIIRAIGPSLAQFFNEVLPNPVLELFKDSTSIATNDDWKENEAEVRATGFQPNDALESAIVRTLQPGNYTAIVRGNGSAAGIGLVEVYDLDQAANSKLANIASRGFVDTGNNVMIAGLIIGPAGGGSTRIVVRANGPSLTTFGIAGALQNPTLDLVNSNGVILRSNDDWPDSQESELEDLALQPNDDRESALIVGLVPGNYTAIVRGAGGTTGVALVEVYNVQ
ncbi:MAG: hypothetical protein QOH88_676 [Verrucomicrobiota bacterium]|jgi:hypothetical protein